MTASAQTEYDSLIRIERQRTTNLLPFTLEMRRKGDSAGKIAKIELARLVAKVERDQQPLITILSYVG